MSGSALSDEQKEVERGAVARLRQQGYRRDKKGVWRKPDGSTAMLHWANDGALVTTHNMSGSNSFRRARG